MFEAIQKSYERLLPIVERGETIHLYQYQCNKENVAYNAFANNMAAHERQTLALLIRTQLMVCRRFEKEMSKLKYPAYSILLKCVSTPQFEENDRNANFTTNYAEVDHCILIIHAVELIFRMNAEGLVEKGGVVALVSLVHYFIQWDNR